MGTISKGIVYGAGGYVGYTMIRGAFKTATAIVMCGALRAGVVTLAEKGGYPDDGMNFPVSVAYYSYANVRDVVSLGISAYDALNKPQP